MHELSLMTGVLDSVIAAASDAGALKVTRIDMRIGEMTEVIDEALLFAFEALSEGTVCSGACLNITHIQPKSRCDDCGATYAHDRFHRSCPQCNGSSTHLIEGRELEIESIEVDLPDEDDDVVEKKR